MSEANLPPEGMKIPKGCENKVLRLKRALYGLKQAGRAWNKKFVKWLIDHGFKVSDADPTSSTPMKEISSVVRRKSLFMPQPSIWKSEVGPPCLPFAQE